MSQAESLQVIRANILARIEEVTSKLRPDYNTDGQQVLWRGYLDTLLASLDKIDAQINASEPYEIISRGRS